MGWSPLWDKIVMSSVWSESKDVKILWITLLALKNRNGEVHGSIVGLAKQAVLSIEEAEGAMSVLTSPDPYTRTAQFEGRRIEVIDGGWRILNHEKYRKMIQEEYRREYNAMKQREYRADGKEKAKSAGRFHKKTSLPSKQASEAATYDTGPEPGTTVDPYYYDKNVTEPKIVSARPRMTQDLQYEPTDNSPEPIEKSAEEFLDQNL